KLVTWAASSLDARCSVAVGGDDDVLVPIVSNQTHWQVEPASLFDHVPRSAITAVSSLAAVTRKVSVSCTVPSVSELTRQRQPRRRRRVVIAGRLTCCASVCVRLSCWPKQLDHVPSLKGIGITLQIAVSPGGPSTQMLWPASKLPSCRMSRHSLHVPAPSVP